MPNYPLEQFANLLAPNPYQVPQGDLTIDWTHPLAARGGLFAAFLPGVAPGIDLTGNFSPLPVTNTYRNVNADGPVQDAVASCSVSQRDLTTAEAALINLNNFSIFWRGMFLADASSLSFNTTTCGFSLSGDPYGVWMMTVDPASLGNIVYYSNSGGGISQYRFGDMMSYTNNVMFDALITFNVGASPEVIGYKNGIQSGTDSPFDQGGPALSVTPIRIRCSGGSNVFSQTNVVYFFNRTLTANEAMMLHLSPYAMIINAGEPQMPAVPFNIIVSATAVAAGAGSAGAFSFYFQSTASTLIPDADNIDGSWTNESGGTTLVPSIDETGPPSDTDYIKSSNNPVSDVCKVSLSNPTGAIQQPMSVFYRFGKSGTNTINLQVRLLEGTTQIASWTHNNISSTLTTVEQVLTGTQFNSIGDPTNLFLEFTASS